MCWATRRFTATASRFGRATSTSTACCRAESRITRSTSGTAAATQIQGFKDNHATGTPTLTSVSNKDFVVKYDMSSGKIIVEEVRVSGGYITLDGHIANTGRGEVRVLGGYGAVNINNTTGYDVVLKRVDVSQRGTGTLVIADKSKGASYATIYQKVGDRVTVTTDNGSGPFIRGFRLLDLQSRGWQRYGWEVSLLTAQRRYDRTATSSWLGFDPLAIDPDTVSWDGEPEIIGEPTFVGEGPYYYVETNPNLANKDYIYSYRENTVGTPRYYTQDEHTMRRGTARRRPTSRWSRKRKWIA
jgi:hypothetical protein